MLLVNVPVNTHLFAVVEMVLNSLNVLVFFVSFAGDKDDSVVAHHHAGGLNGLVAVFNGQHVGANISKAMANEYSFTKLPFAFLEMRKVML